MIEKNPRLAKISYISVCTSMVALILMYVLPHRPPSWVMFSVAMITLISAVSYFTFEENTPEDE